MAHLMSQPPSRSKQDVQLSSSHTYSYNENQIAPERQSIFFSLHVLVHHTSQKRRTFLVIDTSGSQVCVFSVCPYLGVRQFVAEAGSTFGRFHPHLYSTFPLIFFQPPLCWLMPQYHRSDPHFPAIIRPFTLHHEIPSVLTSLLHFFTVFIVIVDPFIYPSGQHTCCIHAIYYGLMDHPHNTQGVVN